MVPAMSEPAALIAQLIGAPPPSTDPATAAVRLARASLDALVQKLGQSVDARVVGPLAGGLTQLVAGDESFVLKLETPLPAGTAVTIKVTPTPQGTPAVTVAVAAAPQPALPLPIPAPVAMLLQATTPQPAVVTQPAPATLPQAAQLALPEPVAPQPTLAATPQVAVSERPIAAQVQQLVAQPPVAAASVELPAATQPLPTSPQPVPAPQQAQLPNLPAPASPQPAAVAAAAPTVVVSTSPVQQAAVPAPTIVAQPQLPIAAEGVPLAQPAPTPVQANAQLPPPGPPTSPAAMAPSVLPPTSGPPPAPPASAPTIATPAPQPAVAAPVAVMAPALAPQTPLPTPLPYATSVPRPAVPAAPQQAATVPAPTVRAAQPTLNLGDPAQAAARQDSAAPLLAKLATVVTAAQSLPRPIVEVALRLLANRVDLNRGAPDARTLAEAVQKSGVLADPAAPQRSADGKDGLLALRSTLLAFLGDDANVPVPPPHRPAPPIKGEPPRAPAPHTAPPDAAGDPHDTARTLLGHTDAALSRLKLLQSASQPPDIRIDAPAAPRAEYRVEIPMLLGAETGILQLLVERDGKRRQQPERERGWRMRFAMNFSATGEVGAEIALFGQAANIGIWAADPDIADALDAMLPELAPAIQRHGLELTSLRVRRGTPRAAQPAPGQLLDSAR